VCGISRRFGALLTVIVLLGYAEVVTAEASVWRATVMAALYFGARMLDHRSPPWNAVAMSAALIVCLQPLDVRNVGFILTFGATAALLEAAHRITSMTTRSVVLRWFGASVAASTAAELALFPVSASIFSRVTCAGLFLNLVAVPAMGLVQLCGIGVILFDRVDAIAGVAGWMGHMAAMVLVDSARLVDWVPWLVVRVPPPPAALLVAYYAGLVLAAFSAGKVRIAAGTVAAAAAAAIVTGQPSQWPWTPERSPSLKVISFDVGQGDATLLEFDEGSRLLVDAGGIPFGGGTFDIGSRVLAPALWARGLRRLYALALTHGDPDHIGGAAAVVNDFGPVEVWEGIPVPSHRGLQQVLEAAMLGGASIDRRFAGDAVALGGAAIRVLHPSMPDWERPRVRNDDSMVLEVRYGDAAVLLLGDVGAAVERTIVPHLTPARIRILKVAHHGSRTSTSTELVERWRPQIAVISCGRGNTFGHPAPEVVSRLESIGAAIYRTDLDGQVTVETDGRHVRVRTFMDGKR
jgi:competence protein ComEC